MASPIEELTRFLKQADNYTQDTREWPDPTEPRASTPPMGKGCTCAEGKKLDCPIHGMHADPESAELDHTWSMPQAQPIGFQQDGPRNWTQAVSRFSPGDGHSNDVADTSNQANQKNQHDPSRDSSNHLDASQPPELLRVRGPRQSRRFVPFGIERLDLPKFGSFVVGNGQGESIKIPDQSVDMKNGFLSFGPLQHVGPFDEHLKDDPQRVGRRIENGSSFGVHRSTPASVEEFIVSTEPEDHSGDNQDASQHESYRPQYESRRSTGNVEDDTEPSEQIEEGKRIFSAYRPHSSSVTRDSA